MRQGAFLSDSLVIGVCVEVGGLGLLGDIPASENVNGSKVALAIVGVVGVQF